MRWIATSLVCLLLPVTVEAKPHRDLSGEFKADRWLLVAQAGTTAADVNRTMRCPAPLECRVRRAKRKKWRKRLPRKEAPRVTARHMPSHHIAVGDKMMGRAVPLPKPRPEMDEEQAAAYRVIAELLAAGKVYVGPAIPQPEPQTLLGGFAREIGRALPRTLGGYLESLFRPVGNCKEHETLDPRVKQIVADAAKHFGGTALMTSCYRSAAYNRRVYARMGRRPTKSLHIARKAVDFKIEGVSKHELAKFARRHKFAGGVGLYCNSIVHVDVGKRRSWNWCGKRRVAVILSDDRARFHRVAAAHDNAASQQSLRGQAAG